MQNDHYINPAVVAQSTLALTVAITCTDAIRDCITAMKPHSAAGAALLRVAAAVILIIFAIIFIQYFSVCSAASRQETITIPKVTTDVQMR